MPTIQKLGDGARTQLPQEKREALRRHAMRRHGITGTGYWRTAHAGDHEQDVCDHAHRPDGKEVAAA